jgi:hypothetical protein
LSPNWKKKDSWRAYSAGDRPSPSDASVKND